jgi:hypothetical protein
MPGLSTNLVHSAIVFTFSLTISDHIELLLSALVKLIRKELIIMGE